MKNGNIDEAFFWREIVSAMCSYCSIDVKRFLEKLEPLREAWEIRDPGYILEKIEELNANRSNFIKIEVSNILAEIK